jgi:8-oxo-dGTP pyrophosphatase MutT (NUDIX family)
VGGKIEPNESVVHGLNREIAEELGGVINDAKLIPIEKFTSENNHFEYHTYVIKVDEEFTPLLNGEHRGYCWVPLEDYPKPLHPGVWRSFKFSSVIEKLRILEQVS